MNSLASLLYLAAFGALAHAVVFPAAPVNISVTPGSTGAQIDWDEVEGAASYVLILNTGRELMSQGPRATFGGLEEATDFTGVMIALDANETMGDSANFAFTTLMSPVEGLEVKAATETSIDIEWMPKNNTNSYEVTVFDTEDMDVTGAVVTVSGTSAMISGLERITFYKAYVIAVGSFGRSEMASIYARTDGSGIVMSTLWQGDNTTIGGQGMIFRPLKIPFGVYRIGVQLPCNVADAEFWNAKVDEDMSDPTIGYYQLYQRKQWMRQKSEIGMNLIFGNESNCDLVNNNVAVTFGDDVNSPRAAVPETFTPIEFDQFQWTNATEATPAAGWIKFLLNKAYHGLNKGDESNSTVEKPVMGEFVIVLDTGAGCPGGITISQTWGMTFREQEAGSPPNMHYFTQESTLWYVERPGMIYGYDPLVCPDQSTMTASVMLGGSMIGKVHEMAKADMTM